MNVLFVSSTGGHLAELRRLADRFATQSNRTWLTFQTPQSESLLGQESVLYVPYVRPRDWRGALRVAAVVRRVLRDHQIDHVVSAGAAVAVGAFIAARFAGVQCTYIESISRTRKPSLTGRITQTLRLATLKTQSEGLVQGRWQYLPGVLGRYEVKPAPDKSTCTAPRLFVTLGTIFPYRFDALVDAVLHSGLTSDSTVWQVGATTRGDLPGRVFSTMSPADFSGAACAADVVITHAGVGSLLDLLDLGIRPIVVPRSSTRGEHVDDHQRDFASTLDALQLVSCLSPENLDAEAIQLAAGFRVVLAS